MPPHQALQISVPILDQRLSKVYSNELETSEDHLTQVSHYL